MIQQHTKQAVGGLCFVCIGMVMLALTMPPYVPHPWPVAALITLAIVSYPDCSWRFRLWNGRRRARRCWKRRL